MAVQTGGAGPYAPPKAVLSLIEKYRAGRLQKPLDTDVLMRAGVSESLTPRTLQSLKLLDLIDDEGNPTEQFEALRLAREEEYQKTLAEFLRATYQEVFTYVDPTTDSGSAIRDAFRTYEPRGQQGRMVTLFLGLAEAAGLASSGRENGAGSTRSTKRSATPRAARTPPPPRAPVREEATPKETPGFGTGQADTYPPAIAGLMQALPPDGGSWTKGKRDQFIRAFQAVLDVCYPVREEGTANATDTEQGELI